jgi:hypothetical protein
MMNKLLDSILSGAAIFFAAQSKDAVLEKIRTLRLCIEQKAFDAPLRVLQ